MKRKAQSSVFFFWTAAIVVCLFAVLLTLLLSSCGGGDVPVTTPPPPVSESESPESQSPESENPESENPESQNPESQNPESQNPESQSPGSQNPESQSPESQNPESQQPGASQTGGNGTASNPSGVVLGETADAGQAYIDRLTFIGDSTTYGLWYYSNEAPLLTGELESEQVWTPTSGTLALFNYNTATVRCPTPDGPELSIADACALKQPEYMVITLGVNGVASMNESYFKECYAGVINTIKQNSPNTKIICNSIYPVGRNYAQLASINNEKINAANEWIKAVAAETGCKYSDTCSVLKDAEGWLPDNLQNGDYIHLNAAGFQLVLQYLRTHAYL